MKVTNNYKQFVCDRICKVILCFEDGCEVTLDQVNEWDFDFDRCSCSYIDLTNLLVDKELVERFGTNKEHIKLIHIEGTEYGLCSVIKDNVVAIDVQCNMFIKKLRLNGDLENTIKMKVQLEGTVK